MPLHPFSFHSPSRACRFTSAVTSAVSPCLPYVSPFALPSTLLPLPPLPPLPHLCRFLPRSCRDSATAALTNALESSRRAEIVPDTPSKSGKNGNVHQTSQHCRPRDPAQMRLSSHATCERCGPHRAASRCPWSACPAGSAVTWPITWPIMWFKGVTASTAARWRLCYRGRRAAHVTCQRGTMTMPHPKIPRAGGHRSASSRRARRGVGGEDSPEGMVRRCMMVNGIAGRAAPGMLGNGAVRLAEDEL